MPPSNAELLARREENIRKLESAHQAKIQTIKAEKAEKAKIREESSKRRASVVELEAAEKMKREEAAKKREENITKREEERKKMQEIEDELQDKTRKQRSKYAKSDVMLLKQIFDEYDEDGEGSVSITELKKALHKQKEEKARAAVMSNDLATRQAATGVDLSSLIEPLFRELDKNGDGTVEFIELLRVMFPFANKADLDTMMMWVEKKKSPEPERPGLKEDQVAEMRAIFNVYDTDRSSLLSLLELQDALTSCGMSRKEIKELFAKADVDNSGSVSFDEFKEMMASSDLF